MIMPERTNAKNIPLAEWQHSDGNLTVFVNQSAVVVLLLCGCIPVRLS
jgi:hypothetical protein